jgi:predicted RNase H-like nuclease
MSDPEASAEFPCPDQDPLPTWVGVDGCPAGWFSVALVERPGPGGVGRGELGGVGLGAGALGCGELHVRMAVDPDAAALWHRWRGARLILIDIPIGLLDRPGPRRCDQEARARLGPRRSSVFPAPSRASLAAPDYPSASALNRAVSGRGLSLQSWNIAPKVAQVDALLRSGARGPDGVPARERIREVHPELLFLGLNGGVPMAHPKRTAPGREERLEVLERHLEDAREIVARALATFPRREVARDDAVDALVSALVGYRSAGKLDVVPEVPERDAEGIPMAIRYWRAPASEPGA